MRYEGDIMVEREALCTVYGPKTAFEMAWREAEADDKRFITISDKVES